MASQPAPGQQHLPTPVDHDLPPPPYSSNIVPKYFLISSLAHSVMQPDGHHRPFVFDISRSSLNPGTPIVVHPAKDVILTVANRAARGRGDENRELRDLIENEENNQVWKFDGEGHLVSAACSNLCLDIWQQSPILSRPGSRASTWSLLPTFSYDPITKMIFVRFPYDPTRDPATEPPPHQTLSEDFSSWKNVDFALECVPFQRPEEVQSSFSLPVDVAAPFKALGSWLPSFGNASEKGKGKVDGTTSSPTTSTPEDKSLPALPRPNPPLPDRRANDEARPVAGSSTSRTRSTQNQRPDSEERDLPPLPQPRDTRQRYDGEGEDFHSFHEEEEVDERLDQDYTITPTRQLRVIRLPQDWRSQLSSLTTLGSNDVGKRRGSDDKQLRMWSRRQFEIIGIHYKAPPPPPRERDRSLDPDALPSYPSSLTTSSSTPSSSYSSTSTSSRPPIPDPNTSSFPDLPFPTFYTAPPQPTFLTSLSSRLAKTPLSALPGSNLFGEVVSVAERGLGKLGRRVIEEVLEVNPFVGGRGEERGEGEVWVEVWEGELGDSRGGG